MGKYLTEQRKDRLIARMPNGLVVGLGSVVQLITHASAEEIADVRDGLEFRRLHAICKDAVANACVTDALRAAWKQRKGRYRDALLRKRRAIENRVLTSRKRKQIATLWTADRKQALKVRRQAVLGALNKPKHSKARDRHQLLTNALEELNGLSGTFLNDQVLVLRMQDGDLAEYIAYCVLHPENTLWDSQQLDESWAEFPLKWFVRDLPQSSARALFRAFKAGEDVSQVFVQRYEDGAKATLLANEVLRMLPVLYARRGWISEAAASYDDDRFHAAVCSTLPLIEGLLWDLAELVHNKTGGIFNEAGQALKRDGSAIEGRPRIGQVLSDTAFGSHIDEVFVRYFCAELYPARNPILHGRTTEFGTRLASARKLAALEYVIGAIEQWVTQSMMETFGDLLDADAVGRFIAGEQLAEGELLRPQYREEALRLDPDGGRDGS